MAQWLGFVAPPPLFFVFLIGATLAYLAIVEVTKRIFYRAMSVRKKPNPGIGARAQAS
jgi:Mg2+-importing ATPase